jgi:hypothetical protein
MNEGLFGDVDRGVALIRNAGAGFTQVTRALSGLVTRTSAGLYVVTLLNATPSANCLTRAGTLGLADANIVVSHTSDTVKTISTFNQAGAATDVDFDVAFQQIV